MPEFPDPADRHALANDCRRCPALVAGRECISWGNERVATLGTMLGVIVMLYLDVSLG
ncbi:hypothetical protein [Halorientalis regularis]|uniref:Uncharacterized protein n=1 Tax=Halorientalis regularis TaxID=660518 RepID=A0A1G7SUC1_9EURY|nr:hypothetical protein SAMN05216218_12033 [Halorientalis regularis]